MKTSAFIVLGRAREFWQGITGKQVTVRAGSHPVRRIPRPDGRGHAYEIDGTDLWLSEGDIAPFIEKPGTNLGEEAIALCFT